MNAAAELLCPQCGTPYEPQDFLCSNCELLLNMDAAAGDYKAQDPSIVRALIGPPQRTSGSKPIPPSVAGGRKATDPEVTVRGMVVMDEYTVPRIVAGLEMALTPLHEFEAHVASFVDGTNSVPQIAQAAEITRVEAAAVFQSLALRRIVELHRTEPEPKAPPPRRAPPPASAPPPRRESVGNRPTLPPTPAASLVPQAPAPPAPTSRPKVTELQERSAPPAPKAESVLERAISLERRGEVEGAINVLKRAITQVSHPAALCNKLALILVNQRKDYKQAEELLNKALRLEPENAVYQQNLYKVIGMAAQKRSEAGKPSSGGGFFSKLLKK